MGFSLGGALGGAMTGFSMGGPWGALAGGAAGGFMGGSKRAPKSPNPYDLANKQLDMNKDAAFGSLINQSGPFGSVNYSRGPGGNFTATTTLDPAAQRARDMADQRLGMFSQHYGSGAPDFSGERQRVEDSLYSRYASRLNPEYDQRENSTLSRLEAQGITQGSKAYQDAVDSFNRERRSAFDEARQSAVIGGGQEQSRMFDMSSAQRGQEFGEIGGLFDLSAANAPQAVSHAGVGSPDLMGAVYGNYGDRLGAHNARAQGQTQLLGGLFNLAGSLYGKK